jgi:hypothetical protein
MLIACPSRHCSQGQNLRSELRDRKSPASYFASSRRENCSTNHKRLYSTMATTNGTDKRPKMAYTNLGSSGLKVSKVIVVG